MSHIDPDQLHGAMTNLTEFVADPDNISIMKNAGTDAAVISAKLGVIQSAIVSKKTVRDKFATSHTIAQQDFTDTAAANTRISAT